MKRILAIALTLVMILAALAGCNASQKPSDKSDEKTNISQNPPGKDGEEKKISKYLNEEDGVYTLTLPQSNSKIKLRQEETRFVPYITDALIEEAEETIIREIPEDSNSSGFYLQINDDYLCLTIEVIRQLDSSDSGDKGCGIDHEHVFYSERISNQSVKEEEKTEFGTGDGEYKKIQLFPQPILEFTEESYDITEFEWTLLSDDDMYILRQTYNDGRGWTDDSVVDREQFFFDGRIRYADMGACGWMYFGFDQNVLYYNGKFREISAKVRDILERVQKAVNNRDNGSQGNEYLVYHIQINSGDNTIYPFGCFLWSKIDNQDGTFTESIVARYDIVDLVSGKTVFPVTDIPKLVMDKSVSYSVQVNGKVEKVYLLAPDGDEYTKTETTFDALSSLADGTYFVVLDVLLSGNCDPYAPQNSYRYEDVFCLVVGEDNQFDASGSIAISTVDMLAQTILNDSDKEIILNILDSDREWIPEITECAWICRFNGPTVNIGYCSCGSLSDLANNRSRKLTAEERKSIEALISRYNKDISNDDLTHSGYEAEIEILQYTWDGWGISTKTVGACDVAYNIIDALKSMKETGETVPKISDDVLEAGDGPCPVERGTMWIKSSGNIYRMTPDLSQICLVKTLFGEGKVLEITDEFKTNVNNAWYYAPYDYYKGTYNKGDSTVKLKSVFESNSSLKLNVKKIYVESSYDPTNTISVELVSTVDQEVTLKLHCQQSDDNFAVGDCKTVQLKKGVPATVELTFGGWPDFTYWIYIEAAYTKAEITINP